MSRITALATLGVCILGGVAASALQQPIFRSGSDIVRVFVTVTDRDGTLVTNLDQNDFEVRDDGKPQPVDGLRQLPKPIELITLLDVSGSMQGNLPLLRAASEQLFSASAPTMARDWARSAATSTSARSSRTTRASCCRRCRARSSPTRRHHCGRAVDEAMRRLQG